MRGPHVATKNVKIFCFKEAIDTCRAIKDRAEKNFVDYWYDNLIEPLAKYHAIVVGLQEKKYCRAMVYRGFVEKNNNNIAVMERMGIKSYLKVVADDIKKRMERHQRYHGHDDGYEDHEEEYEEDRPLTEEEAQKETLSGRNDNKIRKAWVSADNMVGKTFDVDTCFAKVGMRDFLQGNPKQRTCPPPTTA